MKEQLIKFFFDHYIVILMAIGHFFSMLAYSFVEYKVGENPNTKNSIWAIILNRVWSKK